VEASFIQGERGGYRQPAADHELWKRAKKQITNDRLLLLDGGAINAQEGGRR